MEEYLKLAHDKRLNKAEMNSLIYSIRQCVNFGHEAKDYLNSRQLKSSIVYNYLLILKGLGLPVVTFRETERYRFMLWLSLQQTWDKIGIIFLRTNFFDFNSMKLGAAKGDDIYESAYTSLMSGSSQRDVANMIHNSEPVTIRNVTIYQHGKDVIIVSFIKSGNKYKTHHVFMKFMNTGAESFPVAQQSAQPMPVPQQIYYQQRPAFDPDKDIVPVKKDRQDVSFIDDLLNKNPFPYH